MTEDERKEFEEMTPKWEAKKLTRGQMLRYVHLARLSEQDRFNQAFKERGER